MAKETAEQTMARYLKGDEYGYPAAPTCDGDDTDNTSQSLQEHDEHYHDGQPPKGFCKYRAEHGLPQVSELRAMNAADSADKRKSVNVPFKDERDACKHIYDDVFAGVEDVQFLLDDFRADTGRDPLSVDADGDHYDFSEWLMEDRIWQIRIDGEKGEVFDRDHVVAKLKTFNTDRDDRIRTYTAKEAFTSSRKSIEHSLSELNRSSHTDAIKYEVYKAELERRDKRDAEMSMAKDRDTPEWIARKVANRVEGVDDEDKPVEIKVNPELSIGDVTAVDIVTKGFAHRITNVLDGDADFGDGYECVGVVTKFNDIVTKTYEDGTVGHGRTATLFLRKRKQLTPAQEKAEYVRDRAEQKISMDALRADLAEQYGEGRGDWATEEFKKVARAIPLSDGSLVCVPKQKIEKTFWFGYGYGAQATFSEAQRRADSMESDGGEEFRRRNLAYFDQIISMMKSSNEVFVSRNRENGRAAHAVPVTAAFTREHAALYNEDADGTLHLKPTSSKVSVADRVKLIDGFEKERKAFADKLDAWWKKNGASKLNINTYWADR